MNIATKYDLAIIDQNNVLLEVREVEKHEWVTDVANGKVTLREGNDLRGRIGRFRYNYETKMWETYRSEDQLADELDWDDIRKNALSNTVSPREWPKGVRPISIVGTALFGLDGDLTLYWDGKPVEIKKTLSLNLWQNTLAAIKSFSALAVAVVEVSSFILRLRP